MKRNSKKYNYKNVIRYLEDNKHFYLEKKYPDKDSVDKKNDRATLSFARYSHPSFSDYEQDLNGVKIEVVLTYDTAGISPCSLYYAFSRDIEGHNVWFYLKDRFSVTFSNSDSLQDMNAEMMDFLSGESGDDTPSVARFANIIKEMQSDTEIFKKKNIERVSAELISARMHSRNLPQPGKVMIHNEKGEWYHDFNPTKILISNPYIDFEPENLFDVFCLSYLNFFNVDTFWRFTYYFQKRNAKKNERAKLSTVQSPIRTNKKSMFYTMGDISKIFFNEALKNSSREVAKKFKIA